MQNPEDKYTVSPELSGSIHPQAVTTQRRATMRRYTIAKTLALSLGILSVVARSLPERQSEINVRSPGGKHFDIINVRSPGGKHFDISSISLTTLAPLFCPHHCHDHTLSIPDVSDPKQRLEELGLVKV